MAGGYRSGEVLIGRPFPAPAEPGMSLGSRMRPGRLFLVAFGVATLSFGAAQATDKEIDEDALEFGREIFVETSEPQCGVCHTLADAETTGTIAPSLDTLRPTVDETRSALIDGPGPMPSYSDRLSEEEIEAVSQYVAAVAGTD